MTSPEDITENEQAYWEGRAEEHERQNKRIEDLEDLLKDWDGVDSAKQAEWWDARRQKLLSEGGGDEN